MYDKERNDERVAFKTRCLLDINGSRYACLVNNISTLGALVEVDSPQQELFQLGDLGTVNILLLSPVSYPCRIVRIDDNQIALNFLEQ